MTAIQTETSKDPLQHTANIKSMLHKVISHVREDVTKVDDPKAKALFEVTAEVLQGLVTAYEHYENRKEGGAMNADVTRRVIPEQSVQIPWQGMILKGDLTIPQGARGTVLFAHGSGSSRHSPRNRYVAQVLQKAGFTTLLMDLLTEEEETVDIYTRHLRFDIDLLARRLIGAADWLVQQEPEPLQPVGAFGASTGAAAALIAAAERPDSIAAVVSRGGRPDLAGAALPRVLAPTLLIVGGHDFQVIALNQQALEQLGAKESRMEIVPNATHLFEEPGALETVARLAAEWFTRYLVPSSLAAGEAMHIQRQISRSQ